MGRKLKASEHQAIIPAATTMAVHDSHQKYPPILGHLLWRQIVTVAPEKAKSSDRIKAWKNAGRPLKMMVGAGFPSIFSKGRRRSK